MATTGAREAHRKSPYALVAALASALVLIGSVAASSARAQNREDSAPAESLGAGDAVRASAWGPAAIFSNPAGLLRVPVIVVEGGYSYLDGKDGHNATLSLVDARTNQYAALGVAYSYLTTAPDGRDRDGNQVRMALGTGYRSDDMALYAGIGARWLELTLGEEDKAGGESDDIDAWTVDAGLLLDFGNRIRFAVVGQNLIDIQTREAPRTLGFGFSFVFESLDVGANLDLDVSDDAPSTVATWGLGADLSIMDSLHLRTGLTRDEQLDSERMTFGFGWSSTGVAFDLAYATSLTAPELMTFAATVRWVP